MSRRKNKKGKSSMNKFIYNAPTEWSYKPEDLEKDFIIKGFELCFIGLKRCPMKDLVF